ncbi:LOW QUALITY PROTEIN: uncharacterized protein EMH_0089010 [Eimeria mitis]|uniref:Uncharacterized protein n=1 Tax=Eimeria mitis TaxID=44415 RepID=U6JRX4_9EIME|nr:LOW QUALITY PROTEIN: uncharacterized protein EMH_0089010 [Eimeria mitis]CDJ27566.1 hypothetical protein, conserved [Eimeria mitis]
MLQTALNGRWKTRVASLRVAARAEARLEIPKSASRGSVHVRTREILRIPWSLRMGSTTSGHSGSPSRTAEAEEDTASCNYPPNSESRRSGDTPQGGRGSSRDADSHGNFTGTERYYIGSRSSSDASSSGSSSDNGGSSSGSESGSSSSDSSTSRSSGCSSCYSNEGGYQSTENIPSNISSDSGVYETWSSCREFSRRPFVGTRDYEPPVGETEGRISPPFVSTASRLLAPDNTEVEEETKPVHVSPTTLEGEETAHWQDVHAGMRVDTPTRSILSAPSSQASLASRQPLAAGHWPHPASGLAAALSSLAHLVFSSRDPRATATHSEYAAPSAQQRGATHDDSAAAAPEQPREGGHPSLDSQSGVQGSSEASREREENYSSQRDSRELEDDPCVPRLVSDSNAESGSGTQNLNISVRGNSVGKCLPEAQGDGTYGSQGPAGAGMALHGSHSQAVAAEESRDIQEASEGQQKAIGESKKRSFSRDNSNSGRGVALSKQQVGPMTPHLLGRRRFALRRHSGSFHVPHEALRLCSDLPAGSEQLEAECRSPDPPRRRSTFSGAFLPTHSKVRRRPNRGSFISDSSEGLAEDGSSSSGPGSRRDASIESSISGAGGTSSSSRGSSSRQSSASEGYRTCSMFRALPSEESGGESQRPVATKKSMSTNSQSSRTGSGCGLHVVHDEARKRHLTTDSTGRRSFSETPADVQLDKRRRTRWHSCLDPLTDYEDAAVRSMQELPPLGRLRKLASQRTQPVTCYLEQPSAPSEPMLASANSTGWGGSKPLGMAATNRILESAVEFALHKHQRRPGDRIRADRLRSEKLKMLLGGAEDEEPLEERMPGVPASASVDSLDGHPSPVPYKGTMKKRLALHQPALACRMPSHIFCGNFMSASSLWTLQLWRPVAGEDGERPVLSRSSSEAFRKEDSGLKASLQKEGYSTEEEAFRSASSEETLPALSVQPAKRLSRSPINSLLDEVLDFTFFEFGSASARRRSSGVGPSGSTAKASQGQAREESANFQPNNMPKPRRPWACGEPVSVAEDPLCLSGWGAAGQAGGAPVERHADTYLSPEVPTPRFQAGLPVIPSPPGGYAATSPMRIISSPLGPYPGYGPCSGNTIRVESPTRVRYGVGENITAPVSYFEQQGGKVSIPTVQSVYPAEGLQIPRIQTSPCNDWPPAQKPHIPERSSVHPSASYPLTADEKQLQERYSHVRPACIPSVPPHAPSHDPLHNKNPISAVSSRAVSYDELEKLRAQQEQQQKEAEELRRRQEELEKEQNKQREELELERQQLKEQRERLEEQRHALEKEKQDMLSAHLLGTSKSRNRGFESSSGVCKGSPERLPVSNTDEAFDIQRNTTSRTQQGPPIRHTTSTSNISDVRHGGLAVDADGTEEKDISSTVGGRQQTLQPPAASGRFFSRTASVDTNDDKEPILSPQEDLQTDPSMALSTALDKLSKIRMKLDTLQQQLEVQSQEVSSYYSALKAADQVHSSLQQTAADCRVCYGRRHTQMQEVEKRLSVLTAQDLHPCSVDELEELAQELEGTQYKLTVVQAQRAGGAAEEGRKKPKQLLPYSSSCLPEPKSSFAIPEEPVARIGPDECVAVQESALQEIKALGDDLEHIKTVHCEYKRAYKRLQGIMTQQVNGYDVDLQKLVAIEKNLEEKLRRLLFLNGDANYAELSDAQMQEYFRIVNLSIRKVYRELALRESGDRRRNEPRTSGGWLE